MNISTDLNANWTEAEETQCKAIIEEYSTLKLLPQLEDHLEPWDDYSYNKAIFYGWVIGKYGLSPAQAVRISTYL